METLTVNEVRALLEGLPDGQPVLIGWKHRPITSYAYKTLDLPEIGETQVLCLLDKRDD